MCSVDAGTDMKDAQVGVVLVTHNSSAWLRETLDSIANQTLLPSQVHVVDDHSQDETLSIIDTWKKEFAPRGIEVAVSSSTCSDANIKTRIARNFAQGLRQLASMEFVALGDHDDVWLPQRITTHVDIMQAHPATVLLAGNGYIGDSQDTLFEVFGVPLDLNQWHPQRVLAHSLRYSVATGGASMLRPRGVVDSGFSVPPRGWLHDRWWSLLAAAQGGLRTSADPVIRYRQSDAQVVGVSRGRQNARLLSRIGALESADISRIKALHALKPIAAPELQRQLSWGPLLKAML